MSRRINESLAGYFEIGAICSYQAARQKSAEPWNAKMSGGEP